MLSDEVTPPVFRVVLSDRVFLETKFRGQTAEFPEKVVDIRKFITTDAGTFPTTKGITFAVDKLPEVIEALHALALITAK